MFVLQTFSLFYIGNFISNENSSEFLVRGKDAVLALSSHFCNSVEETKHAFFIEWENFKFDLVAMKENG